ncbi:tetratricopeptide repeat protein [Saccharothrix sp. HUAS TT1]|uniref:ATP-binding protein n=1 Tax=unclassified Saccharothrix TaxID=2593673 RepID=UPI00345B86D0
MTLVVDGGTSMPTSSEKPRSADPQDYLEAPVLNQVNAYQAGTILQAGKIYGGIHLEQTSTIVAPIPQQLPAVSSQFVGRAAKLAALDRAASGSSVLISAIGGSGGIGKTWLAIRWAHEHIDAFPDGQLFVDLRGFSPDGEPMSPSVAIKGFLAALNVDPNCIPVELHSQVALYRSIVAKRRMLIILDNAVSSAQVDPLLPGGDSCVTVVTSRRVLNAIISRHGAHHVPLDTLDDSDAHALLALRLGTDRIAEDVEAVAGLIKLCKGLPIALSVIAGRAVARPHVPLADFAIELRDFGLAALEDDDPTVSLPAILSWSYSELPHNQQIAFGLLGIAPGPSISLSAAANLLDMPLTLCHKVLRALEDASLLHRGSNGRYSMHDLVRSYASNTTHHLDEKLVDVSLQRLVDFYLLTAYLGERLLDPHRPPITIRPLSSGCRPAAILDYTAAMTWFDVEHMCLLASQHVCVVRNWHQPVWQLAWTLHTFHIRRGHRQDHLDVWQAGLTAAEKSRHAPARIRAYHNLGHAIAQEGQYVIAIEYIAQALGLARSIGDHANEARAHRALAMVVGKHGNARRALEHATSALSIYRTLGNPVWEASALDSVGVNSAQLGLYDSARQHCEAALALYRKFDRSDGEADALSSLAGICYQTGNYRDSVNLYQQALSLYRRLGHSRPSADVLNRLGQSYIAIGEVRGAHTAWSESLRMYGRQGRNGDAAQVQRQLDKLGSK